MSVGVTPAPEDGGHCREVVVGAVVEVVPVAAAPLLPGAAEPLRRGSPDRPCGLPGALGPTCW
jgi:hypothetical protein